LADRVVTRDDAGVADEIENQMTEGPEPSPADVESADPVPDAASANQAPSDTADAVPSPADLDTDSAQPEPGSGSADVGRSLADLDTDPAQPEPGSATADAGPSLADSDTDLAQSEPGSGTADVGPSLADPDTEAAAQPDAAHPDPAPEEHITTGHAEIDTALRRLDELDGLPVEQHGEVYDELHGRLRDALTAAATPTSESSDA
jgi:hypothetical protein